MSYTKKLSDPRWQKKRLEVLSRDNFKCTLCLNDKEELHVHHLKYTKEPWDAPLKDLETLCFRCHEMKKSEKVISAKLMGNSIIYTNLDIVFIYKIEEEDVICSFSKSGDFFNYLKTL
jgi:hypothetical protein